MLLLIGLSGKAESGKDTFAKYAKDVVRSCAKYWNLNIGICERYALADALKEEAVQMYGWDGKKDEKGRTLLQELGQKRRVEDPDYWIKKMAMNISNGLDGRAVFDAFPLHGVIFITDMRFKNEKNFLSNIEFGNKNFGDTKFISIRIEREGYENNLTEEQRGNISECDLDDEIFDYVVENNGEIGFFIEGIETTMLSVLGELR